MYINFLFFYNFYIFTRILTKKYRFDKSDYTRFCAKHRIQICGSIMDDNPENNSSRNFVNSS